MNVNYRSERHYALDRQAQADRRQLGGTFGIPSKRQGWCLSPRGKWFLAVLIADVAVWTALCVMVLNWRG